jgi:hypothetical protein
MIRLAGDLLGNSTESFDFFTFLWLVIALLAAVPVRPKGSVNWAMATPVPVFFCPFLFAHTVHGVSFHSVYSGRVETKLRSLVTSVWE